MLFVQTALNSLMDLIKFFFVLLLPAPHTFGILILLSYLFIRHSSKIQINIPLIRT